MVPSPPKVTTRSMFSALGPKYGSVSDKLIYELGLGYLPGFQTSAPWGMSARSSWKTRTPGYVV